MASDVLQGPKIGSGLTVDWKSAVIFRHVCWRYESNMISACYEGRHLNPFVVYRRLFSAEI